MISGLYHLYGAPNVSLWLRQSSRGQPVPAAQHSGQVHQVRTHFTHALHAGHVQQRQQGTGWYYQCKMFGIYACASFFAMLA